MKYEVDVWDMTENNGTGALIGTCYPKVLPRKGEGIVFHSKQYTVLNIVYNYDYGNIYFYVTAGI